MEYIDFKAILDFRYDESRKRLDNDLILEMLFNRILSPLHVLRVRDVVKTV